MLILLVYLSFVHKINFSSLGLESFFYIQSVFWPAGWEEKEIFHKAGRIFWMDWIWRGKVIKMSSIQITRIYQNRPIITCQMDGQSPLQHFVSASCYRVNHDRPVCDAREGFALSIWNDMVSYVLLRMSWNFQKCQQILSLICNAATMLITMFPIF